MTYPRFVALLTVILVVSVAGWSVLYDASNPTILTDALFLISFIIFWPWVLFVGAYFTEYILFPRQSDHCPLCGHPSCSHR